MKVLKFGGTSVGSIDNMMRVKELITDSDKKIVVLYHLRLIILPFKYDEVRLDKKVR